MCMLRLQESVLKRETIEMTIENFQLGGILFSGYYDEFLEKWTIFLDRWECYKLDLLFTYGSFICIQDQQ